MIKRELRQQLLYYRKLLSPSVYLDRNARLNQGLQQLLESKPVTELHVFLPMESNREPDCSLTIEWAWKRNLRTITTKTDFSNRTLSHYYFDEGTVIATSKRGIPEPQNGQIATLDRLSVIIVPLMAFDTKGHRVGYGGGYYDRILAEVPTDTLKVGVSLSGGMDTFNFVEAHDRPLDVVITPYQTVHIHE